MFFPDSYRKPVLLSIVEAATSGWGASCEGGSNPGSSTICGSGGSPTGAPVCLATGSSPSKTGDIYYRGGSSDERLFNTDDMGEGF